VYLKNNFNLNGFCGNLLEMLFSCM